MTILNKLTRQIIPSLLLITLMFTTVCPVLRAQGRKTEPIAANLTAPTNDNFANAQPITMPVFNVEVDVTQATGEPGEPDHANASGTMHSVWFTWTAANNYSVTAEAVGNLDSALAVYTGNTIAGLSLVTANDNVGKGVYKYSRVTFTAVSGITYHFALAGAHGNVGTTYLNLDINLAESGRVSDFDGNTRSDFAVYRPSTNFWYVNEEPTSNDNKIYFQFGVAGDVPLTGDYTGDGNVTDICVWRESTGFFYVYNALTQTFAGTQWGAPGDIPVPGDFDGDDVADLAIWRPSTGTFWVLRSTDGGVTVQPWGQGATDVPVPADYDGDGKTDFAVRRNAGPAAGTFYILYSSTNSYDVPVFGFADDLTVPGDFDLDGKADIAVYRPSNNTFYVISSQDGHTIVQPWGLPGDIPVPGDYLANPHSTFAVWRPSNGTLYVLDRYDTMYTFPWGTAGDIPVASLRVR
jgi:hypothetical protein